MSSWFYAVVLVVFFGCNNDGCQTRMHASVPNVDGAAEVATTVPAPSIQLTVDQMHEDLELLREIAGRAWAYADDKKEHFGVDLDALLSEALAATTRPLDRFQFREVLVRFVAGMKDGHAGVVMPGASAPPQFSLPFFLREATVDGAKRRVLVAKVLGEVPVQVGDELVGINGRPLDVILREQEAVAISSTPWARRAAAISALRFVTDERATITVRRPDGTTTEAAVDALPTDTSTRTETGPTSFVETRELEPGIGYLRIPSFAIWMGYGSTPVEREQALAPVKEEIDAAFAGLDEASVLVLDVRQNAGGTDILGMHVAQHLLEPGFTYFGLKQRYSPEAARWSKENTGFSMPQSGWAQEYPVIPENTGIRPFQGSLVVLLDEGCFSTTDNFLAALQDNHKSAVFVGRPSGGGTGAPRPLAHLPNSGATVVFCMMQITRPNGELIEGRGVAPDIRVEWTRDDLLAGRDPDLEVARSEARKLLAEK